MTSAFEKKFQPSEFVGSRFIVRFGMGCAIVAVLGAVLLAGYRAWLRNQIRLQLDNVRKVGLPVTLDEVDNWYQRVPIGENAGAAFSEHFYVVKAGSNERNLPIAGDAKLPKLSEKLDSGVKLRIGGYLEDNRNGLEVVHQAMRLGKSRYPIDLNLGAATLLPHLNKIREAKNLLQLQAIFAGDSGNRAGAIEAVTDQFRLAETLNNEPVMISQMIRLTLINEGVESVQRMVSIFSLSVDEIERLSEEIARVQKELRGCWQHLIVGERSLGIDVFKAPPNKVMDYLNAVGSANNTSFSALIFATRRLVGIWDADYLFYLRTMERADALSTMKYSAAFSEAGRLVYEASTQTPQHMMSVTLLPNFQTAIAKLVGTEAALRACLIGLAIERYDKETGHLPDQLPELVPQFLKTLPLDPGNDTPFRYTQNETGYSIESGVQKSEGHYRVREKNASGKEEGKVAFTIEHRAHRD